MRIKHKHTHHVFFNFNLSHISYCWVILWDKILFNSNKMNCVTDGKTHLIEWRWWRWQCCYETLKVIIHFHFYLSFVHLNLWNIIRTYAHNKLSALLENLKQTFCSLHHSVCYYFCHYSQIWSSVSSGFRFITWILLLLPRFFLFHFDSWMFSVSAQSALEFVSEKSIMKCPKALDWIVFIVIWEKRLWENIFLIQRHLKTRGLERPSDRMTLLTKHIKVALDVPER